MAGITSAERLIRGLEENLWSFWSRFGRAQGCTLHEDDCSIWFETPIPIIPYNTVIRFRAEDDGEASIRAIVNHFARRGIAHAWILHPSSLPEDLDRRLKAHGLEEVEVVAGMAMELADVPEVGDLGKEVEIVEVHDLDKLGEYLDLAAWRWEVPEDMTHHLVAMARAFDIGEEGSPVRLWVAYKSGKAVSKVALNLDNGVAGIYGVATLPEARGLGLARELTVTALQCARDAGYDVSVLHSTPMAHSLYQAIGFRDCAPFRVFAPPQSFHL
jgi:GNAT superfamily N-acetyltransferase